MMKVVKNNKFDLKDTYKKFQSTIKEYVFFSSTYWAFSKMEHLLGNKIH